MNVSHKLPSGAVQTQRGFSLVEIMVALLIGLVLMGGMIQLLVGTKQTYRFHEALSRIQENGRFAMEFLAQDLRMTGFTGCPRTNPIANVLNTPAVWWTNLGPGTVMGYDGNQIFPGRAVGAGVGDRINGTDAATFLGGSGGYFITALTAAAAGPPVVPSTFTLNQLNKPNGGTLSTGDIVILCDAQRTSLFQITNVAGLTISHAVAGNPGNSTAFLFPPLGTLDAYVPNRTTVVDYTPSAYYVGVSNSGVARSLYRLQLQVTAAGVASMVTQELVEGVENMQVFYGVDANNDGQVDPAYVDASAVANWNNVLSVRVILLLASPENTVNLENQWVMFPPADTGNANTAGSGFTAGDRRLYQVFSTTVGLRNRLP
jgi:type IV pilus assembly protein PilW